MRAAITADDSTNNNNNNNSDQDSEDQTTTFTSWGTWEELLLACAVKRHGLKDWDSVAMELQSKTSLPALLTTAYNCKLKYYDLRRRFNSQYSQPPTADAPPPPDHHDANIPWLDDLRQLRLAQLRQELNRYDVSIMSLQLKVKKLEEEREASLKDDEAKPDLEMDDSKGHRSENDKNIQDEPDRFKPDHENQSVNGSNSTCSKNLDQDNKVDPVSEPDVQPAGSVEPSKGTGGGDSESDSDKGSSETVAKNRSEPGRKGKGGTAESSELRGESAGEMRESSEAQSSASLTRKWKGKRRRRMEAPEQQQLNNGEELLVKSQPLVGVLEMIRAHEHSSLFERRLPTQESDKYKSMVQQHVDLATIQTKLQKDSYSSCALSFYRDLLLLFSNAVVFFPKSSLESMTAHQLRRLVLNEMKKNNLLTTPINDPSPEPSGSLPLLAAPTSNSPTCPPSTQQQPKRPELERSDSLLAKHKSTQPIIVCRKRSSISSKPSASSTFAGQTQPQKGEDQKKIAAAFDLKVSVLNNSKPSSNDHAAEDHGGSVAVKGGAKAKDNPVTTGTRSSRRTSSIHQENNKATNNSNGSASKKQSANPASLAAETPKADKKVKTEAAALDKKRSAAADFLKRIKRNSNADTSKSGGTGTSTRSGGEHKRRGGGGKVDKVKERVLRQSGGDRKKQVKEESSSPSKRSVGRPSKKAAAEAANVVASPKRARENGGKQEASRRPRKRSRR